MAIRWRWIASGILLAASSSAATAQPATFELAGTHPQAAAQRTAAGRVLGALEPWRGRLYAGYGDYGANTGPIAISPFDPETGAFEQTHVSDTEAIENWRAIGDRLFAPASDRRKGADYAIGEPWADVGSLNTTHAYDIVTLDGSDLWLTGSQSVNAAVWRSTDGGATWRRALAVGPESGLKDDFARFYFAGIQEGRLYVQADDFYGDPHPRSKVFDGSVWSDGPNLLPYSGMGWRPVAFAGQMVYRGSERGGPLLRFDGERAEQLLTWNVPDIAVVGGTLVALTRRLEPGVGWQPGPIVRTTDLARWEALDAVVPDGAASLAVLGGRMYVGASEARLFHLASEGTWAPVESPRWNALPAIRLLAPRQGATFAKGTDITFLAEAADPDGGLSRVQFWAGQLKLGEPTMTPFAATWQDVMTGTHRVVARAIDADGAMTRDTVTVRVAETGNHSPVITKVAIEPAEPVAGQDIRFVATATDPDGDALQLRWLVPGAAAPSSGFEIRWTAEAPGTFDVTAVAEDAHGAVALRTVRVTVRQAGARVHVPYTGRGGR